MLNNFNGIRSTCYILLKSFDKGTSCKSERRQQKTAHTYIQEAQLCKRKSVSYALRCNQFKCHSKLFEVIYFMLNGKRTNDYIICNI